MTKAPTRRAASARGAKKTTANGVRRIVSTTAPPRASTPKAPAKAPARKATSARPAKGTNGVATKTGRTAKARRGAAAPVVPTLDKLRELHPDAHCELVHEGAFQLLVATVLSAQTTDVNVNKATGPLFAAYPDARALARATPEEIEPYVAPLGFFRQKAKFIVGLAKGLIERHGGEVPQSMAALTKLPGVGRKTANVVLGVIWNAPDGVVVDTHVQRLSQRLGWTTNTEPEKIEQDLCARIPRDRWDATSHLLIFHGRRVCFARKPACDTCGLSDVCPSAFDAELVGRKPPRERKLPAQPAAKRA